ncbi:Mucin-2 [Camelus dromedarius]|uniref:Mucin-2 n=1 Tax=Camelus dromedarius TaxID=9838 RepID=A0A5N4BYB4_CAMDR|nr:Mucin-2 [Camelus dromedarius]
MTKAQPLQGTSTEALSFGRAPPEGPWRPGLLTPPPAAPPEGRTRNHGHSVCSTWGDSHYKTFDGDVFRFPGLCDYNFASDCRDAYKEFAVHLKRGPGRSGGHPQIEYILLTVKDDTIYLTPQLAVVNGAMVSTPHYSSGLLIEKSDAYTKVYSRAGLALMWDREDSLMLELDSKFQNHTCGLCGDYNGLQTYSEFLSDGVVFSPIEFGNLQKINKPEVVCEDPEEVPASESCSEHRAECESLLMGTAFEDCQGLVPLQPYVQACVQDRCQCAQGGSCVCSTVAEFSRQCSHAGGRPGNWRTATLCAKSCPGNMVYLESGSPCVDTCSHLEVSSLCEEHRMDGCFCPEGDKAQALCNDDIAGGGCIPVSPCHCKFTGACTSPASRSPANCEQWGTPTTTPTPSGRADVLRLHDKQTCLKTVVLWRQQEEPHSPSSNVLHHLLVSTAFGLRLQVQLLPVMSLLTLDRPRGTAGVCQNGRLLCKQVRLIDQVSVPSFCRLYGPKIHVDCNNLTALAIRNPRAASCQKLAAGSVLPEGVDQRCVCPRGCLMTGRVVCGGGAVPLLHNSDVYPPGPRSGWTATPAHCQKGRWACTQSVCHGTCAVYGNGHYITFDGRKPAAGPGPGSGAPGPPGLLWPETLAGLFSIVTENVPCGTTGVTARSHQDLPGEDGAEAGGQTLHSDPVDVGPPRGYTTRESRAHGGCSLRWTPSPSTRPASTIVLLRHRGDCEVFCSAVASYAQECTKEGACVTWRTPELCYSPVPPGATPVPQEQAHLDEDLKKCVRGTNAAATSRTLATEGSVRAHGEALPVLVLRCTKSSKVVCGWKKVELPSACEALGAAAQ